MLCATICAAAVLFFGCAYSSEGGIASVRAVATFHSIGLYWKPEWGAKDRTVSVRYRKIGAMTWRRGHELWFDDRLHSEVPDRSQEYRGSLVELEPGTTYEIELIGQDVEQAEYVTASTWSERVPIGSTTLLPSRSDQTLRITQGGSPSAYALYTGTSPTRSLLDTGRQSDYNIVIDAPYVVVRGLDLRNAVRHAVLLTKRAHHVVIERNDVSGWGRIAADGFGVDGDSAITNEGADLDPERSAAPDIRAIIIQNNRFHHPASNANAWTQFRELYGSSHPAGPQAITLWETGGNHVIRYNEIFSDSEHYFNDCIGGGENFGYGGGPGRDSDIYGNRISDCWDDGIESEGGNVNVRIWGNFIDRSYVMIAASPTMLGPLYVFRNVVHRSRYSPRHGFNTGVFLKAQSRQNGDHLWGGGRVYVYHNTLFRTSPEDGTATGISPSGSKLLNYVSRNNIFDVTQSAAVQSGGEQNDFDYDLFTIPPDVSEPHGRLSGPIYRDPSPDSVALAAGSPGQRDGSIIPNFSDGFVGAAPDRGAAARGRSLRFGIR